MIDINVGGKTRQFDLDNPDLPDWVEDHALTSADYAYDKKLNRSKYNKQLDLLHLELVKLQAHRMKTGQRMILVFEGRDAAGEHRVVAVDVVVLRHLDDASAGPVGRLHALAVGRGHLCGPGQHEAEGLGQRVHRARRAHGVAETDGRGGCGRDLHEAFIVNLSGRQFQQKNLAAVVDKILRETGLQAKHLEQTAPVALQERGAGTPIAALFGSGYQSS